MGYFQVVVSGLITLLLYGMLFAGLHKLFQISGELSEIKEILRDIRRNTDTGHPYLTAQGVAAAPVELASLSDRPDLDSPWPPEVIDAVSKPHV